MANWLKSVFCGPDFGCTRAILYFFVLFTSVWQIAQSIERRERCFASHLNKNRSRIRKNIRDSEFFQHLLHSMAFGLQIFEVCILQWASILNLRILLNLFCFSQKRCFQPLTKAEKKLAGKNQSWFWIWLGMFSSWNVFDLFETALLAEVFRKRSCIFAYTPRIVCHNFEHKLFSVQKYHIRFCENGFHSLSR